MHAVRPTSHSSWPAATRFVIVAVLGVLFVLTSREFAGGATVTDERGNPGDCASLAPKYAGPGNICRRSIASRVIPVQRENFCASLRNAAPWRPVYKVQRFL